MQYCKVLKSVVIVVIICILPIHMQSMVIDGCIEYLRGVCIRCSFGTHLFGNFCYQNIAGCETYTNGNECLKCDLSITKQEGTTCVLLDNSPSSAIQQIIYLYGNPGSRFGETDFIPIPYDMIKNEPSFRKMNNFVLTGQRRHFISLSQNPVSSVSYYVSTNLTSSTHNYKIIYEGSGGGIILYIGFVIEDTQGRFIKSETRSMTPIGVVSIIDNCIYYKTVGVCDQCKKGYYLYDGSCYQNIGGCIKYIQNICLECVNLFLLVENRCESSCSQMSDTRTIWFYEGNQKSSLETTYSRSLQTSYSFNVFINETTKSNVVFEENCAVYAGDGSCEKCSFFFYKDSDGKCKQISPLCQRYNQTNGDCLSCFSGYTLINGECKIE